MQDDGDRPQHQPQSYPRDLLLPLLRQQEALRRRHHALQALLSRQQKRQEWSEDDEEGLHLRPQKQQPQGTSSISNWPSLSQGSKSSHGRPPRCAFDQLVQGPCRAQEDPRRSRTPLQCMQLQPADTSAQHPAITQEQQSPESISTRKRQRVSGSMSQEESAGINTPLRDPFIQQHQQKHSLLQREGWTLQRVNQQRQQQQCPAQAHSPQPTVHRWHSAGELLQLLRPCPAAERARIQLQAAVGVPVYTLGVYCIQLLGGSAPCHSTAPAVSIHSSSPQSTCRITSGSISPRHPTSHPRSSACDGGSNGWSDADAGRLTGVQGYLAAGSQIRCAWCALQRYGCCDGSLALLRRGLFIEDIGSLLLHAKRRRLQRPLPPAEALAHCSPTASTAALQQRLRTAMLQLLVSQRPAVLGGASAVARNALIAGMAYDGAQGRVLQSGLNESYNVLSAPPFQRLFHLLGASNFDKLIQCILFVSEADLLRCTSHMRLQCYVDCRDSNITANDKDSCCSSCEFGGGTCCNSGRQMKRKDLETTRLVHVQICGRPLTNGAVEAIARDRRALEEARERTRSHQQLRQHQEHKQLGAPDSNATWAEALSLCSSKRDRSRCRAEGRRAAAISRRRRRQQTQQLQHQQQRCQHEQRIRPSDIEVPRHAIFYHRSFSKQGGLPRGTVLTALCRAKPAGQNRISTPTVCSAKTASAPVSRTACNGASAAEVKGGLTSHAARLSGGVTAAKDDAPPSIPVPGGAAKGAAAETARASETARAHSSLVGMRCVKKLRTAARVLAKFVLTDPKYFIDSKGGTAREQTALAERLRKSAVEALQAQRRAVASRTKQPEPSSTEGGSNSNSSSNGSATKAAVLEARVARRKSERRLRLGSAEARELVPAFERLLERHQRCRYLLLLARHCRIPQQARQTAAHWRRVSAAPIGSACIRSGSSTNDKSQGSSSLQREPPALELAVPTEGVSAFAVAAARKVVPFTLLGSMHNYRLFLQRVRQFVCLNAKETFTVHQLMHRMQTAVRTQQKKHKEKRASKAGISNNPSTESLDDEIGGDEQGALQQTSRRKRRLQQQKRKSYLERIVFFLFSHFIVPLLRCHFYVTDAEASHHRSRYFRKSVWFTIERAASWRLYNECFRDGSEQLTTQCTASASSTLVTTTEGLASREAATAASAAETEDGRAPAKRHLSCAADEGGAPAKKRRPNGSSSKRPTAQGPHSRRPPRRKSGEDKPWSSTASPDALTTAAATAPGAPTSASALVSSAVPRIRFVPKLRGCRPIVNLSRGLSGAPLARQLLQILGHHDMQREKQLQTAGSVEVTRLLRTRQHPSSAASGGATAVDSTEAEAGAASATAGGARSSFGVLPFHRYVHYLRRLLREADSIRNQQPFPVESHRERCNALSVNSVLRPVSQHLSALCRFHPEALGCSVMSNTQVYINLLAWWRLYQRRLARVRLMLQREGPLYGIRRVYIHRMQRVVGDLSRCFESICHEELEDVVMRMPLPSFTHRLKVYRRVTTPGSLYYVPKKPEGRNVPSHRQALMPTAAASSAADAASCADRRSPQGPRRAARAAAARCVSSSCLGISTFGALDEFCIPPVSLGDQPRLSTLLRTPRKQNKGNPAPSVAAVVTELPPTTDRGVQPTEASAAQGAQNVPQAPASLLPPGPHEGAIGGRGADGPLRGCTEGLAAPACGQPEAVATMQCRGTARDSGGCTATPAGGKASNRGGRFRAGGAFAASCVRRLLLRGTSAGGCSFVSPQCTETRVTAEEVRAALLLLLRMHCVLLPRSLPPLSALDIKASGSLPKPSKLLAGKRSGIYKQLQGIPQGANLSGLLCALFYADKDRHPDVQRLLRGKSDEPLPLYLPNSVLQNMSPATACGQRPHAQHAQQQPQEHYHQQVRDTFEILWEGVDAGLGSGAPRPRFVSCGPFLFEISSCPKCGEPQARKVSMQQAARSSPAAEGRRANAAREQQHEQPQQKCQPQVSAAAGPAATTPRPCKCAGLQSNCAIPKGLPPKWRSFLQRVKRVLLPPLLLRWVDDFVFASPGVAGAAHFLRLLTERQMWGANVNTHKLRVEVDAVWECSSKENKMAQEGEGLGVMTLTRTAGSAPAADTEATGSSGQENAAGDEHRSGGPSAGLCWAGLELTIPSAGQRLDCKAACWKDPQQLTLRDAAAMRRRKGCGFMSSMLEKPLFGFLRARLGTPLFLDLRLNSLQCVMHSIYVAVRLAFQRLILSTRRIIREFGGFLNPHYLLGLSRRLIEYVWLFLRAHARPAAAVFAGLTMTAKAGGASTLRRAQGTGSARPPPLTARAVHARLRCIATFAAARVFKQRLNPVSPIPQITGPPKKCEKAAKSPSTRDISIISRTPTSQDEGAQESARGSPPKEAVGRQSRHMEKEKKVALSSKASRDRPAVQNQAAFSLCYVELLRLTRREARASFTCCSNKAGAHLGTPLPSQAAADSASSCNQSKASSTANTFATRESRGAENSPRAAKKLGSGTSAAAHRSSRVATEQTRELLREVRFVALHAERENQQAWPRCTRQ